MLVLHEGELAVDVGAKTGERLSDILLVAFLRHAVSTVGRGENAGKNLEEFNIVRRSAHWASGRARRRTTR